MFYTQHRRIDTRSAGNLGRSLLNTTTTTTAPHHDTTQHVRLCTVRYESGKAFERRRANKQTRASVSCCGVPRPLGLAFAQGPALHAFCTELICCFYPGATWLFPAHHTSSCRRDATLLANCLPFRLFLFFSLGAFHPVAAYLLTLHIRLTRGLVSYAGCCTSLVVVHTD